MARGIVAGRFFAVVAMLGLAVAVAGFRQSDRANPNSDGDQQRAERRAVIYVMPSALMSPEAGEKPPVVVGSGHDGDPQVAKIYQELQHNKNCLGFSENMVKDKADYFLLLQHGGGRGNRWAISDKDGSVIASGESFTLGSSVSNACLAMAKDWKSRGPSVAP